MNNGRFSVRNYVVAATVALSGVIAPAADASSAAELLGALSVEQRDNAELQLEFQAAATVDQAAAAAKIELTWNSGDYAAALFALDELEASGASVAPGIAWRAPVAVGESPATAAWGGDVQIGAQSGLDQTAIDYDVDNGNLFAVVMDEGSFWTLNQSTDHGQSWVETYYWGGSVYDVDVAVVDDYVYVGYVTSVADNEARLRRADIASGTIDGVYGFQVVYDASPNSITEIALAQNADWFNNRVYYAALLSSGAIEHFWIVASVGTSFNSTNPPIANADRGLDLHPNNDYTDYYLFMSYIDTSNNVMLGRLDTSDVWDTQDTFGDAPPNTDRTSIAAEQDTAIIVFEDDYPNGVGIAYRVTYNAGNSFAFGTIDQPTASEGAMSSPDVASRSGTGLAVAYNVETSEPDEVRITYREGYAFSNWRTRVINEFDVSTGSWTSIVGTPFTPIGTMEYQHGAIYLGGALQAFFTRPPTLCADVNCDGVVDTYDIDAFIAALLGEAEWSNYMNNGGFPLCDFLEAADINDDGVVDTYDIDAFVAAIANGGCP